MGLTIGVAGASGGLGASTLVATLVMRADAVLGECRVGVGVDLDPRGGLDTTMCLEHLDGMRWADVENTDWVMSGLKGPLRVADLPGAEHVHVLSGGGWQTLEPRLVDDALDALDTAADVIVVDCGHRPSARLLSRLDLIAVLARTTARGAADLVALRDSGPLIRTDPVLVTRGPGRERHGAAFAAEARLPFLAHLPDDPTVRRYEREGVPPGLLRSAVDVIADEVLMIAQSSRRPTQPSDFVAGPRVGSA